MKADEPGLVLNTIVRYMPPHRYLLLNFVLAPLALLAIFPDKIDSLRRIGILPGGEPLCRLKGNRHDHRNS
jgi:hypothetical protein